MTVLPLFVSQAHAICLTVPEARTHLQQMIEENQASLLQARDKLEQFKKTREDQIPTEEETANPTESDTNVIVFIVLYLIAPQKPDWKNPELVRIATIEWRPKEINSL